MLPPLRLLDVLPSRPTTSDAVEFIQFAGTGDAAEQEHEGDTKAQLAFEDTPGARRDCQHCRVDHSIQAGAVRCAGA